MIIVFKELDKYIYVYIFIYKLITHIIIIKYSTEVCGVTIVL